MPTTYQWTAATNGSWNTTTNWTPNGTPGTGDTVVWDAGSAGAMTVGPTGNPILAKVQIKQSCPTTSYIGTPAVPIAAAVTEFVVGEETLDGNNNDGCRQICWNFGASQSGYNGTTARILRTATSGVGGLEVVQLVGTHANNAMFIEGPALVGWGVMTPGQAYTLSSITISNAGARVRLGSGGTVTTIIESAGFGLVECGFTTLNQDAGDLRTEGSGAITTANVGGNFVSNATGTIGTLDVDDGGLADFSQSSQLRTVTNSTVHGSGRINARTAVARAVTFTNPTNCIDGAYSSQVDLGTDVAVGQNAPS
jgi:hypothetical protein